MHAVGSLVHSVHDGLCYMLLTRSAETSDQDLKYIHTISHGLSLILSLSLLSQTHAQTLPTTLIPFRHTQVAEDALVWCTERPLSLLV